MKRKGKFLSRTALLYFFECLWENLINWYYVRILGILLEASDGFVKTKKRKKFDPDLICDNLKGEL